MSAGVFVFDTRQHALPLALMLGGVGLLSWAIVGTGSLVMGLPVILAGFAALLVASLITAPLLHRILLAHAVVIVFLILGASRLCASQCGVFPFYDHIGGVSTSLCGIILHLLLLVLGASSRFINLSKMVYCAALSVGIGASCFFMVLMVAKAHWCPACAAAHAVVLIQAVTVYQLLKSTADRTTFTLCILVIIGAMNALFHHQAYPRVLNRPDELLGWISCSERGIRPLGMITATAKETSSEVEIDTKDKTVAAAMNAARQANKSPRKEVIAPKDDPRTVAMTDDSVARATAVPGTTPAKPQMGCWGDPQAPIRLVANVDPMCAYCQNAFEEILKIKELVEGKDGNPGSTCVEFALAVPELSGIPHFGAQTASYLIYAASDMGPSYMLGMMRVLMSDPGREAMQRLDVASKSKNDGNVRNALAALYELIPDSFDKAALKEAITRRSADIKRRNRATLDRMNDYGSSQAPNLWFYRTKSVSTEPFVILRGAKDDAVLRYTISQGLKDQAQ